MLIARRLNSVIHPELVKLIRSPKSSRDTKVRAEIWLYASQFSNILNIQALSELLGVTAKTVRKHVKRLDQSIDALEACASKGCRSKLVRTIEECLMDAPRSGRPFDFSPLQIVSIISIACEKPEACGRPIEKWTSREIADEAMKRKIVSKISRSYVAVILRSVNMKPHKSKGWCFTTEKDQQIFEKQAKEICDAYLQAQRNYEEAATHTVSVDEATGLQANEKRAPSLPPKPDQQAKEETQYIRHGTLCLLAAWHVVLGKIIHHSVQPTRNNLDFANFIEEMLKKYDAKDRWVIILDNLNIHLSDVLVRLIARLEGIDESTLGDKKKRKGILGSMKTRREFLTDPKHRIRFVFTPKHSSWLNQIENVFGVIKRRALAGASFKSQSQLIDRIDKFIPYYNETFAKPMKWTYTGRPTEPENLEQPLTWRQRVTTHRLQEAWNEHSKTLAV